MEQCIDYEVHLSEGTACWERVMPTQLLESMQTLTSGHISYHRLYCSHFYYEWFGNAGCGGIADSNCAIVLRYFNYLRYHQPN